MNLAGSTHLKYVLLPWFYKSETGWGKLLLQFTGVEGTNFGNQFWQPYRLSSYIYLGPTLLQHDHSKAAMVVLLMGM